LIIIEGKAMKVRNHHIYKWALQPCLPWPRDDSTRNRTSPFAFTATSLSFAQSAPANLSAAQHSVEHNHCWKSLDYFYTNREELKKTNDLSKSAQKVVKEVLTAINASFSMATTIRKNGMKKPLSAVCQTCTIPLKALPVLIEKNRLNSLEKYKVLSADELHSAKTFT